MRRMHRTDKQGMDVHRYIVWDALRHSLAEGQPKNYLSTLYKLESAYKKYAVLKGCSQLI
jgi:hypothetical protein